MAINIRYPLQLEQLSEKYKYGVVVVFSQASIPFSQLVAK